MEKLVVMNRLEEGSGLVVKPILPITSLADSEIRKPQDLAESIDSRDIFRNIPVRHSLPHEKQTGGSCPLDVDFGMISHEYRLFSLDATIFHGACENARIRFLYTFAA
jgi:hypothetical protein